MCSVVEVAKVPCETIEDLDCKHVNKICQMTLSTVISSTGVSVSSKINKDVKTISVAYNKKVEYLPENLHEVFPDLTQVDAVASSLKQLSKATFKNLFKLEKINLDGNKIERIDGDTFEDLTLLKKVFLSMKIILKGLIQK